MRVLLSIGPGRLHFVPAAEAMRRRGVDLTLILGWTTPGWLARRSRRLAARSLPPDISHRTCAVSELATQSALRAVRLLHCGAGTVEALGWQWYGCASRRHIGNADIFHVRSGAGGGGAIRRARRLGMKVLVDHSIAHPLYLAERVGGVFAADSPFWRNVLRDCQAADILLVNSDFVRETFIEHGFPCEKLRVVYLGVEQAYAGLRQSHASADRPLKLLFVGNFGRRKGADDLLEAMRALDSSGLTATLDVVGSVERVKERLPANVVFHGPLPPDGVRHFLRQADIFVFPTLAEGCARAVMEAMAAGVCVVTTRQSGAPISDGETGFLVPARDATRLAERLAWLARHRGTIDRVGAAAELVARRFTWEAYACGVVGVYRELLRPLSGRSQGDATAAF